jgi:hypothetical protein
LIIDEQTFRQAVQVLLARMYKDHGDKHDLDEVIERLEQCIGEQVNKSVSRRPLLRSRA